MLKQLKLISAVTANGMEILKKNYPHFHAIMLWSQERYVLASQGIQNGVEQTMYYKDESAFKKLTS